MYAGASSSVLVVRKIRGQFSVPSSQRREARGYFVTGCAAFSAQFSSLDPAAYDLPMRLLKGV